MFRAEQRCRDQNIPAIKEHRCTVYTARQSCCIGLKLIKSSLQEEATKRWLHLERMGNHAEMRQHLDRMSALTGCDDSIYKGDEIKEVAFCYQWIQGEGVQK